MTKRSRSAVRTSAARAAWALSLVVAALALGCATHGSSSATRERLELARSRYDLGVDYIRNDLVALGLRELLEAEALDPENPMIKNAIGDVYRIKGRAEDTEIYYRRVLEMAPDYHTARLNLAGLYIKLSRYEECVAETRILVDDATFPAPWRALVNQGWAEFKLGQTVNARKSLELALDYRPHYWPALLNLGILEMEVGHRLEAVERFRRVLDLAPSLGVQSEANYRLGEIYISLGKRKQAVRHLMAAVADAPGGQWGQKSEEYLKLLR